ncbi:MAG TPA: DUF3800 domain-containing protein [Vicinamibacterales bacterium]|nr:DUF3800 domain-containing protein [Vicinamibacterales bacterium]
MQLYFDESGNTGTDLLNKDQPVFALASTSLDRAVCEELLGPLLVQGQTEAKYSKLKGTRTGQKALTAFVNSPLLTQEACIFMQADKEYYLLTHLVDKVIEPIMHDTNFDLYAGDAHVGLTNLFYFTGAHAFPKGHWPRLLKAFLQALRQLSPESISAFREAVEQAVPDVPAEFVMLRDMLVWGAARAERSLKPFRGTAAFDPAVDVFIAVVNLWMRRHIGPLQVIHDRSKPLRHSESLLRAMMTDVPPRVIGYGKRKAELPLRVSDFKFDDSRTLPQLQVADLIAGLSVDCLLAWSGRRPCIEFHEAIRHSPIGQWTVQGMLPDPEMRRANEPGEGEVSLVDGGADFMKEVGFDFTPPSD